MFVLCPGEFIHAVTTSAGVNCPAAMFSPAAVHLIPFSAKTVCHSCPSGRRCANDVIISLARIFAAALSAGDSVKAFNPSLARSILISRTTSELYEPASDDAGEDGACDIVELTASDVSTEGVVCEDIAEEAETDVFAEDFKEPAGFENSEVLDVIEVIEVFSGEDTLIFETTETVATVSGTVAGESPSSELVCVGVLLFLLSSAFSK